MLNICKINIKYFKRIGCELSQNFFFFLSTCGILGDTLIMANAINLSWSHMLHVFVHAKWESVRFRNYTCAKWEFLLCLPIPELYRTILESLKGYVIDFLLGSPLAQSRNRLYKVRMTLVKKAGFVHWQSKDELTKVLWLRMEVTFWFGEYS